MRHRHKGGSDRRFAQPDDLADRRHGGHHHQRHHGHHGGGRRGNRFFDYGELRLVTLAMIADQPRHGYELMKAIEDRMNFAYIPSPGVMYPTLSWLEDMDYAIVDPQNTSRKRYRITPEGEAFLTANRASVEALFARIGTARHGPPPDAPPPVVRAMENLKFALRLRERRGPIDQATAEAIAAILDSAAVAVERT